MSARASLAGAICARAFETGLIIETSGDEDEVVKVLAPLTIAHELFEQGLDILRGSGVEDVARPQDSRDRARRHRQADVNGKDAI